MKRFAFFIMVCVFAFGAKAQDVDALFVAMPDGDIPQLENAWRKDLVDLYKSGKEARLKNTMNGFSTLKKLTADYLLLQVTERSTIEIRLLPLVNNTKVICLVRTVCAPVADSRVEFFTTEWEPLDASDMFTPVSADWFIKEDADRSSAAFLDAASRLDMTLMEYRLSPDSLTLTATYNTPQYLSGEDRARVDSFLKQSPKVYVWDRHHFK